MSDQQTTIESKIDKLTDLVEKVAIVVVKQDAHESQLEKQSVEIDKLKEQNSHQETKIQVLESQREEIKENNREVKEAITGALKWGAGILAGCIVMGIGAIASAMIMIK